MQTNLTKNTSFFERILQIIDYYNIKSVNSFAKDYLKYESSEKINRLKKENTSPSYEILTDITNKFEQVDANWLLTGKGNMLQQSTDFTINQSISGDNNIQASNSSVKTDSVSNAQLLAEIKELKQQIAERDKTINSLIRQQEKLINKLTL